MANKLSMELDLDPFFATVVPWGHTEAGYLYHLSFNRTPTGIADLGIDEVPGGGIHNDHPKYQDVFNALNLYYSQPTHYANLNVTEFVRKMVGDP